LLLDEWNELFVFGESLVEDYGLYLPARWFEHVGIATEVLHLAAEYIAAATVGMPLTNWFTHLEGCARRCGAPWSRPGAQSVPSSEQRKLGGLYAASLLQLEPQDRVSIAEFHEWVLSDKRPRPRKAKFEKLTQLADEVSDDE
jgi:hypothetical protein